MNLPPEPIPVRLPLQLNPHQYYPIDVQYGTHHPPTVCSSKVEREQPLAFLIRDERIRSSQRVGGGET